LTAGFGTDWLAAKPGCETCRRIETGYWPNLSAIFQSREKVEADIFPNMGDFIRHFFLFWGLRL